MAVFDTPQFYVFVTHSGTMLKETCSTDINETLDKMKNISDSGDVIKFCSVVTKTDNKHGGYNKEHKVVVKSGFVTRGIVCV